ncbi:MAG: 30S ribosomal protein S19 [Candidatus Kappaea frigidicola]|nr:30S ribosomal protein S19 [Candidatus Kappaea frigidicola]
MSRSAKKGPFVNQKLVLKVEKYKKLGQKQPIKTWARSSMILPDFLGVTFTVHNGKKFIPIFITEKMVGHRLGEFAPTRTFRKHGSRTEKAPQKK